MWEKVNYKIIEWCSAIIIFLNFIALIILSWRKTADILVDFGRELYVPWQLIEGKVLYRDIAYFNGPFSPYFNALLYHFFGVSSNTIIICNLVIIFLSTILIYILIKNISGKLTATISCLAFLKHFCF